MVCNATLVVDLRGCGGTRRVAYGLRKWGRDLTVLRKNGARALTVAVPFPEQCVFAMVYRARDTRPNRIQGFFLRPLRYGHLSAMVRRCGLVYWD